jgi:hypothetical protein
MWLGVVLLGLLAQVAVAQDAQFTTVQPLIKNGQLYIDADAEIQVSDELRTAAIKGVPLYFTANLEIISERWWWFDKVWVDQQQTWRLAYNVLTRQWRIGAGDLTLPEATFEDAMSYVRHIRGWSVADVSSLDPDVEYRGRIRLQLDTSRLPRPFRIDAYNSSAWSLATPWKDFRFSISSQQDNPS